jgi:hypothetical protein
MRPKPVKSVGLSPIQRMRFLAVVRWNLPQVF